MDEIPNYHLLKAATRADASAGARLLLVHLIGYLGRDDPSHPSSRFIVFPGNPRLATELRCSARTIQRHADELEEKGLLRRCYNSVNRRTGFDLAPLAMVRAEIVESTARDVRADLSRRQASQMSLDLDPIERPRCTPAASSRRDSIVTPIRPVRSNIQKGIRHDASDASVPRLGRHPEDIGRPRRVHSVGGDRTEVVRRPMRRDQMDAHGGLDRPPSASHVDSLPTRTASPGGLAGPDPASGGIAACASAALLRDALGARTYDQWLGDASFSMTPDGLSMTIPAPFRAEWVRRNLAGRISSLLSHGGGAACVLVKG